MVRRCGLALKLAAPELRRDRVVVLSAVLRDGSALQYAGGLQAARALALAAVREEGDALAFASEELRDDREVVAAAVSQDGAALRFASARLRADGGVALRAVRQAWRALGALPEELRGDPELVAEALAQSEAAWELAPPSLGPRRGALLARAAELRSLRAEHRPVPGLRSAMTYPEAVALQQALLARYGQRDFQRRLREARGAVAARGAAAALAAWPAAVSRLCHPELTEVLPAFGFEAGWQGADDMERDLALLELDDRVLAASNAVRGRISYHGRS